MTDHKMTSEDLRLIDKIEKGYHNNALRDDFRRLKPRLVKEGVNLTADGAWARAMLGFVPALIAYLDRERHAQISPYDTIDGLANAIAEIIVRAIRQALPPAEHRRAFDAVLQHLRDQAGPRLARSDGGILLPPGHA